MLVAMLPDYELKDKLMKLIIIIIIIITRHKVFVNIQINNNNKYINRKLSQKLYIYIQSNIDVKKADSE